VIYHRIFPRYSTKKINAKITFLNFQTEFTVDVENISLGGLQLRGHQEIPFPEKVSMTLNFLNREAYQLEAKVVWTNFNREEKQKMYGLEFIFNEAEDFQKWLILIRAFHLLKRKKQNAST
jgi:c-di-GMP-binding flagellar brake protein YcgR